MYVYIYIYIYIYGGICRVMFIVTGNGYSDPSSNPGHSKPCSNPRQDCVHFTLCSYS